MTDPNLGRSQKIITTSELQFPKTNFKFKTPPSTDLAYHKSDYLMFKYVAYE